MKASAKTILKRTDESIVQEVLNGDVEKFNLLVEKYQHKLTKVISHYIWDPNEVNDVVQETLFKVFRALDKFRGDSSFYTWIYRIAVNTAKNYLVLHLKKNIQLSSLYLESDINLPKNYLQDVATPEHMLLMQEIETVLSTAMLELPQELQIAIKLREWDGLTYDEISGIMDCPIGTVRSRIFRAREALDKAIAPLIQN